MIAHVDMDCFYASVELLDKPYLFNKPVAVGGSEKGGVLTTCNYVARQFGVRSAMSGIEAKRRCPKLIFLPLNFHKYREMSARVKRIIANEFAVYAMASIDEAYVELNDDPVLARAQAENLKYRIQKETGLNCSIGVAPNKMLAKIASDYKKPDAFFFIADNGVEKFMATLPVSKVPGIGPKTQEALAAKGILTCGDVQFYGEDYCIKYFGPQWGHEIHQKCLGIGSQRIQSDRERKSLSMERTFSAPKMTFDELKPLLEGMKSSLEERLRSKEQGSFQKVFVRLKFADFQRTSRECITKELNLKTLENLLWEAMARSTEAVRLMGVGVRWSGAEASRRRHDPRQLKLF